MSTTPNTQRFLNAEAEDRRADASWLAPVPVTQSRAYRRALARAGVR
jgi:hypothetical protein